MSTEGREAAVRPSGFLSAYADLLGPSVGEVSVYPSNILCVRLAVSVYQFTDT